MSNPIESHPGVVEQLRPVSRTGESTATYELNKSTASPQRIIGRDARGLPIMDTVPTVPWRPFLTKDGCINKVPIRTGSIPSMHADAVAYENETFYDLIVDGWIPAWLCPFSTNFAHLTHGPFVTPPAGESDCGGSNAEGGCVHLKAIAKLRRDGVRAEYDRANAEFIKERDAEMNRMRDGIVAGVGEAIAKHMPQQAANLAASRNRLRDTKGEVEG